MAGPVPLRAQNIPNPFDPMLDFLHHGGSFSTEHGFIDIYAPDGARAGIPMFKYVIQGA